MSSILYVSNHLYEQIKTLAFPNLPKLALGMEIEVKNVPWLPMKQTWQACDLLTREEVWVEDYVHAVTMSKEDYSVFVNPSFIETFPK